MDARDLAEQVLEGLRAQPPVFAALTLGVAAALEYVVPPFPGDTIAVAGGVLVAQGVVSVSAVLLATTLGSVAGSLLMYGAGSLCSRHERLRKILFRVVDQQRFERVSIVYRKWGRLLIVANRFFPGLRVTFIVAAGLFGIPLLEVVMLGAVSAFAWNAALISAGYALGANLDAILDLLERYTTLGWIAVASIAVLLIARIVIQRVRGTSR